MLNIVGLLISSYVVFLSELHVGSGCLVNAWHEIPFSGQALIAISGVIWKNSDVFLRTWGELHFIAFSGLFIEKDCFGANMSLCVSIEHAVCVSLLYDDLFTLIVGRKSGPRHAYHNRPYIRHVLVCIFLSVLLHVVVVYLEEVLVARAASEERLSGWSHSCCSTLSPH